MSECEPRGRRVRSTCSAQAWLWEPTAVIPRSHARSRRRSTSPTTRREQCFGGTGTLLAFWRTDPAYPFGMYVANTDGHIRVIFQTDHDQLLIGSLPPVEQALAWRTDPEAALISDLASDSTTGPLVAGSAPDGPVRGTVKERYFFRRGAGNGWTLVGDAGHHKEFVIGDGITEALLQARSLAFGDPARNRRGSVSVVASSGRRRAAVLFPRAGRRGAGASDGASASRLFARGEDARASGANGGHDSSTSSRPLTRSLFDKCFGGHWGPRSADRWASYHSSSRWADGEPLSTASCVCADGFSLRQRPARYELHRQR